MYNIISIDERPVHRMFHKENKESEKMNKPTINNNARYLRTVEACSQTNYSRNILMKVATEANAVVRIGRTVRIDMPVLYKYIDAVYKA